MAEKLLSIIIPVYNRPKELRRCMDGVLNIEGNNYEVILVDDCSTDETGEVCEDYAKHFKKIVRTVHVTQNRGPGNARNTATSLATGKYLFYVDSDDEVYPENISRFLKNRNEWEESDIICFSYTVGYQNKNHLDEKIRTTQKRAKLSTIDFLNSRPFWLNTNMWQSIYLRSMVCANNITCPETKIFEDARFAFHAFVCSKSVSVIEECLYHHYYNTADSLTGIIDFEDMLAAADGTLAWIIKENDFLSRNNVYEILKKRISTRLVQLIAYSDNERFELIRNSNNKLTGIMLAMSDRWKRDYSTLSQRTENFSKPLFLYPGGKAARRLAEKIILQGGRVDGFIDNYLTEAIINTPYGEKVIPCVTLAADELKSKDVTVFVASFNEAREKLMDDMMKAHFYLENDMFAYIRE